MLLYRFFQERSEKQQAREEEAEEERKELPLSARPQVGFGEVADRPPKITVVPKKKKVSTVSSFVRPSCIAVDT